MHWLRQHVGAKGELPPYADIAPSILRSHPPNPDVLPYVYKFMSRFGEASMMKNTESFVAAFGSVKNQLGASVWDALSLDTKHKNEDLVLWRQALLKTMMTCNDRVVSVGDIKRSLSNAQMLTKIIVFEKNLLTLKNEMPKFKLTEFQKIAGLGAFEVRCVKPKDPDAQLTMPVESVEHAAYLCHGDWNSSSETKVPNPWPIPVAPASAKAAPSTAATAARRGFDSLNRYLPNI